MQAPSAILPSARTQGQRRAALAQSVPAPQVIATALEQAGVEAGFKPQLFAAFFERLPRMLDPDERLTLDGFRAHGLGDVMDRLIARTADGWMLATYAFPKSLGRTRRYCNQSWRRLVATWW